MKATMLCITALILMLTMSGAAYPGVLLNGIGNFFAPETNGKAKKTGASGSEFSRNVEGAGRSFGQACKDIHILLAKIERSEKDGLNYEQLQVTVDRAIMNLMESENAYRKLLKTAEKLPRNKSRISNVRSFDYNNFARNNRSLNPVIFKKVKRYFQRADIPGIFSHYAASITRVKRMLTVVGNSIDQHRMPELERLWKLNEKIAEINLFGVYVSRICHATENEF